MKTIKSVLTVMVISSLVGCSSTASRMADCEAQGISRDTCYSVEQNRKSDINAAAEKQALENAQALYPVQHAQSAKKPSKASCDAVKSAYVKEGLKGLDESGVETYEQCFSYTPVKTDKDCASGSLDLLTDECVVDQKAQSSHKQVKRDSNYQQFSNEAQAVIGGTIGDGAEFLLGQGWKPNNGKWYKKGYILQLVVEDGIVQNAQLTK